jgi:membrane protein implicated in regulation of membrane protease activity
LPGTVLLVLVLILIHRLWVPVPLWLGISIVAAAILKDILLFPLLWRSYSEGKTDVPSTMIGRRGIATSLLDPEGYVRVRGELWRGEVAGNIGRIEKGRAVIVVGISGLKLYVGPDSRAELEN